MSSIFKSSVALPISIALLLSACGGGSSSSTNDDGGSSSTPATISLSAKSMTVMIEESATITWSSAQAIFTEGLLRAADTQPYFDTLGTTTT
ncbi:MAG: hypothetical protein ACI9IT_002085 [Glaciecola sp.]|jgi:hypothetical protein